MEYFVGPDNLWVLVSLLSGKVFRYVEHKVIADFGCLSSWFSY